MDKKIDNTELVNAIKELKANRNDVNFARLLAVAVRTTYYVPISIIKSEGNEREGVYCIASSGDGKSFLSVFTNPEELKKCYDTGDIVHIMQNFSALRDNVIAKNKELSGIVINPGGDNMAILREQMLPLEGRED